MQVKLIFEAQLIKCTAAFWLADSLEGLQPALHLDATRHMGKILADSVEKRMNADKLGAAKTVRDGFEQAHAVLLLAALKHPAANAYAMVYDLPIPQEAFQVTLFSPQSTPKCHNTCCCLCLHGIGVQLSCRACATPL